MLSALAFGVTTPPPHSQQALLHGMDERVGSLLAELSATMDADRAASEWGHTYRLNIRPSGASRFVALGSLQSSAAAAAGTSSRGGEHESVLGGRLKEWHLEQPTRAAAGITGSASLLAEAKPAKAVSALVVARCNESIGWLAPVLTSGAYDEVNFYLSHTGRGNEYFGYKPYTNQGRDNNLHLSPEAAKRWAGVWGSTIGNESSLLKSVAPGLGNLEKMVAEPDRVRHDHSMGKSPPLRSTVPPNIGREAVKYLSFILDRYDNMPEYVMFIQAGGETRNNGFSDLPDRDEVLRNWAWDAFPAAAADANASGHIQYLTTMCVNYIGSHNFVKDETPYWKRFVEELYPYPFAYRTPCCSEFGVNRAAIVGRSKAFWEKTLLHAMEAFKGNLRAGNHWAQANWYTGWVFEILWRILFKTADQPTPEMFTAANLVRDQNDNLVLKPELVADSLKHCSCGAGGRAQCGKDCCRKECCKPDEKDRTNCRICS